MPFPSPWLPLGPPNRRQKIVRDGVSLSEKKLTDAGAIGVQTPESGSPVTSTKRSRDRLSPRLKAACDAIDFLTPATRGLTLGHGVFIRSDCWRDRLLIVHELAHIAHNERLGGYSSFPVPVLFKIVLTVRIFRSASRARSHRRGFAYLCLSGG